MEQRYYTKKQCMEMGLNRTSLERAAEIGWPLCFKSGVGVTSPLLYDMEELLKWYKKQTMLWKGKRA